VEEVQAFIQKTRSRLDVTVDINDQSDGSGFNAENFRACFMAAAQAASRWRSLDLISPPPHGEYKDLQILQPLERLESFKLAWGFGEFVEPLMTAISRGAPPKLTAMDLADPVAVLYLVQPACLHITNSLRTLKIQLSKRMDSPVDILPHLHQLETFEACRLCLPIYPPDASLPLIHTLRLLDLKSVSVQWMAGHVFPALKTCHIVFPHHVDTIQAIQAVVMPSCMSLIYKSSDIRPLAQFHISSRYRLNVECGQWNVQRGDLQLAALYPIFAAGAQILVDLYLDIRCSEQLLAYILGLAPALKHLRLGLASPKALSKAFFRALTFKEPGADSASKIVGPSIWTIAPLCPSLKSLNLHYRRWLRGPDERKLTLALAEVVASRQPHTASSFSLKLRIDEANSPWNIGKPVKKFPSLKDGDIMLGISAPNAIIPMSLRWPFILLSAVIVPLPFKEIEYLYLSPYAPHMELECSSIHDHMVLMGDHHDNEPVPPSLPCPLPILYTLRVLVVDGINSAILAGCTFHKLERCRVKTNSYYLTDQCKSTETEMPVCTRVDVNNPYLLATFKLPPIRELAVGLPNTDHTMIWENHIAVKQSLSGLTLLHLQKWIFDGDLVPILRSVPLLETLIISARLGVVPFRAFLPMDAYGISGLKQPSGEGQALVLLCPRLQSLQIEGQRPSVEPELIPILKDIVTLRAECRSPLKYFTFSESSFGYRSQVELIGRTGSFTMGNVVVMRAKDKEFKLDI
jgi:hypothetical protein